MARKFGKVYELGKHFWDYSYIINGVAGVGKTTLAYELGLEASGSNEGTFIITCGREPIPKHIPGAFGEKAITFKDFVEINRELCENKDEYPDTKFVCWDSLDELYRVAESHAVLDYNKILKDEYMALSPQARKTPPKYAKSIAQTYGGFQKGENKVVDIVINEFGKLIDAGYQVILLGHTKVKNKTDLMTGVTYEQIGCNLDNKYYNALKDKVNLVCTAYFDHEIEDVVEEKNAFTKKIQKKGTATNEKRMAIFLDDNNAVDTKTHFANIAPKIEFNTKSFIKAVQDAIDGKMAESSSSPAEEPQEETTDSEDIFVEDELEEEPKPIDRGALANEVKSKFGSLKDADLKNTVKGIIAEGGGLSMCDIEHLQKAMDAMN